MKHEGEEKAKAAGVGYSIIAYIAWGLLPLYWKYLDRVSAFEILAHRIFWSFLFVAFLLMLYRRWEPFKKALLNRKIALAAFLSSVLISANWFIYIWGVNNGHVIEASLGYYINPLLSVALGVVVLKERLSRWQTMALMIASIGVIILTVQYGKIPWISFALAITFGFYGLAKKKAQTEALVGLALETVFMAPLALGYIVFTEASGVGVIGLVSLPEMALLIGTGVVTALPLLWFAKGARSVPLSTMGFIQYMAPTISLILGIFVFKEVFTSTHMISFAFIWCALLLYSLSYTSIAHTSRYGKARP
ncbi:EamA family transporter RarD [Aneurinibacillus aneurinilyticus]|jgi:chloramphenicol-sensitive protein RarD|uniref:EamA family transporter RarD n=2 Tax=Aneurinibacillus aneurinilyticus TaxID=1391 RepID=A0A848CPD8_ANEAE|nr:EamA family transporter RarD [Aneurinibacillus aneurinilyticus]ERI04397.1 protein RarD [Aneurinibacillus aneurinilyticus ATCC 12856]MCI1693652.1 EamA family transporter RarD [Aneurinibacillus aneurinilyticus]MED0668995.1 EamA family transporter RarD [Aneurinibacillus aneurinilyticus]MED0708698.1 EamA family transporter RarD [Aneurinibacillus aneurinilyticus]MED0724342.1 EamA family transporter RarD [Aneurinibacillus aneurinilyticus]